MINIFSIDAFITEIIMNTLCMFVLSNTETGTPRRDMSFRKWAGLPSLVK